MKFERSGPKRRNAELRIKDWKEVYLPFSDGELTTQAARCMDCGIPFCHQGCPLGNLIPEWNDLTFRNDWSEAINRLHATNNFPEFTGRLCPAPCETACVVGISQEPVAIKLIEQEIVTHGFNQNLITPIVPTKKSGKRVAIVGSGPAGLAAAQQLTRAGHHVILYEKADRIGGLLRYGIPEFKMEKQHLDRRLDQMRAEGTIFVTGVDIGKDISASDIANDFDAVLITVGAEIPRDIQIDGRELTGIHQAMEYLPQANLVAAGDILNPSISAFNKNVVIIGGGDTGADCLGTAIRQGAKSITQIEIMPRPSNERPSNAPWPMYPMIYRISSAHEEGGTRDYALNTSAFLADETSNVRALLVHEIELKRTNGSFGFEKIDATDREIPAELVLLAMGFTGTKKHGLINDLNLELTPRGSIAVDSNWATNQPGIFAAGDARRGQSLIVWAIAEGRSAAASVDRYLMGMTDLPSPITPMTVSLAL